MPRIITHRLDDIREQADLLKGIAESTSFDDFNRSIFMRHACQYSVLIIAEAVNNIPKDILATQSHIAWHRIIAVGNKLRHEYHRVDAVVIWDIMTQHMDALQAAVREIREAQTTAL